VKPTIAGIPGDSHDVAEIIDLVRAVQRAQHDAAPAAFMRLFRKDAVWTTAHGKWLTGYDEISEFTHRVLPGAAASAVTATYEAEHILFIRPDVAAVKILQRPVTRDGRRVEIDPDRAPDQLLADRPDAVPGSPIYVLTKDGSEWKIAAAQNTKVVDPETFAAIAGEVSPR
jgi:uncharacterized protein (TIGR02246 family)